MQDLLDQLELDLQGLLCQLELLLQELDLQGLLCQLELLLQELVLLLFQVRQLVGLLLFLLELLLEQVPPSVLELLWGLGLLFQQGAAEQEQVALQERGQVLELELLREQVPELEQGQVLAEQQGRGRLQQ